MKSGDPHPPEQPYAEPTAAVLAQLLAGPEGLNATSVVRRRTQFGDNTLPSAPGRSIWQRWLAQFRSVLVGILLLAALLAFLLDHTLDAAVIVAVVLVNALVGYWQEGHAEQALAAVQRMLTKQASVRRDGHRQVISAAELVPGDIVLLDAGDRVPADLRLLRVRNLRVDESAMTGESVAVEKHIEPVPADAGLGDRRCMAHSGTLVATGQATGVVVAIGPNTELGRISGLLGRIESNKTPLLRQMDRFAAQLTVAVTGLALITFGVALLARDYDVADSLMLAVALAVAAIPEGLPVIVTITLALGVQAMARRKAIVRQLPAVETLGAVSVICSDKTGTLTCNEMTVAELRCAEANYQFGGVGYQPSGDMFRDGVEISGALPHDLAAAARIALLCNDAVLREIDGQWQVEGDPMEGALRCFAHKTGLSDALALAQWPRLDEIPFDTVQRYMASLHADGDQRRIVVKGAPERLLALCQHGLRGERIAPLQRDYWHSQIEAMAQQGQRVLALAEMQVSVPITSLEPARLQEGLVLVGLAGLIDPPREEARAAVAECHGAGIRVIMITGDHALTAAAIGKQLGLVRTQAPVTGEQIEQLDGPSLRACVARSDVFARTSPEHKLRLVEALQAEGAVIAMTGDGVNDAPALKRADIGIAMGGKGTEAAKEASRIVLADDNFASIVAAVREGRTVYDNISKAVAWSLPTNGGEALVILAAVLFGLVLPITPLQILWINMVTAITLGMTFAFEPTEPGVMQRPPRPIGQPLLSRFLLWRIVTVSLLFAAAAFGLYEWALHSARSFEAARTLVVNGIVSLEVFYLFSVRFLQRSSLNWRGVLGTRAVWIALAFIVGVQLALTYAPPMQYLFGTVALPLTDLLLAMAAGVLLMSLLEVEKWWLHSRAANQRPHQ